jgi:ribosome recycling factor
LFEANVETWLSQLTLERRKAFIDALFDVLGASEGKKVDPKESLKDIGKVIKNLSDLDEETRKMLSEVLASIKDQALDTISKAIREKLSLG